MFNGTGDNTARVEPYQLMQFVYLKRLAANGIAGGKLTPFEVAVTDVISAMHDCYQGKVSHEHVAKVLQERLSVLDMPTLPVGIEKEGSGDEGNNSPS